VSGIHYYCGMRCLLRRDYDAATLIREHPPRMRHPHKRLVYELCGGNATTGALAVTRWAAERLPANAALVSTEVISMAGYYDYAGDDRGVWHVNFADPQLFVAYGSPLLAQDELQAAEHPVLGAIREALIAEGEPALTEEDAVATPVLVVGAERRCTIETAPDLEAGRVSGLYGNRFAAASADVIRRAIRVHRQPARTNLIAIAAPVGSGEYMRPQLERILVTAYSGFAAAIAETQRMWPGAPTEVRTGFWGCGAFGGNRQVMVIMQVLAARLAGVSRLRVYAFDAMGRASFTAGAAALDRVLGEPGEPLGDLIERIADLDYQWGVSDGN
jgi:Poly (ADP-ribose) glycohydrolase (PARG), Macro domain fold